MSSDDEAMRDALCDLINAADYVVKGDRRAGRAAKARRLLADAAEKARPFLASASVPSCGGGADRPDAVSSRASLGGRKDLRRLLYRRLLARASGELRNVGSFLRDRGSPVNGGAAVDLADEIDRALSSSPSAPTPGPRDINDPAVVARAAEIERDLEREERPAMKRLADADKVSGEDRAARIGSSSPPPHEEARSGPSVEEAEAIFSAALYSAWGLGHTNPNAAPDGPERKADVERLLSIRLPQLRAALARFGSSASEHGEGRTK